MGSDAVVIRPPSEASSFLLPVMSGCSHNRCTFCGTYKGYTLAIRDLEDVKADIDDVAWNYGSSVRRIFLENGDALVCPQPFLVNVLNYIKDRFPQLERVSSYAAPKSVLKKTPDDLKELRNLGLTLAYMGVESGDDAVLRKINKGVTSGQIIEAGRKLKEAGITISVTVILGLAGVGGSESHAVGTAKVLTDIDPDFAGALTLMLVPGTPLYQDWEEGRFTPVSPFQALTELKLIIERSSFSKCFFTANHASNYLPIKVHLPEQNAAVIKLIDDVLASKDVSRLRPDYIRGL